ncbi:polyphosphate polymerase domain-containing protein [Dysosmobacter sp.]|uniref:polyphosphate polymerase domain-containing protein n=1 Tax=Dysosmobacter sp. TaxID=2591382 RepID=UPI002A8E9FBA|nr:polyphosphate polymerase domain-containing protein [Dysosmobacter sp.]MDY3985749.1 polyphosphate polymerase domain-containing protein [Dysosmobacter sp.]
MGDQMVFKRYEIKYLMNRRQRDVVLRAMEPYLSIDEYGRSSIRSIYYDTSDFRLIRESLEKPVYKEKLRVRGYGPAKAGEPVFVELKKKYKDVVYKRRISLPQAQAEACLAGEARMPDSQIGREIAYALDFYQALAPAVFLSYEREAFFARDGGDFRVTFDENIRYRQVELTLDSDAWGTPILKPDQVLMELKTSGGLPLWLVRVLSRQKIFKTSFSKYGTAYQDILLTERKGVRQYA